MLGWEAFRMAGRSLRNHPGRSILTILGVVIGIGSVIAIVSLGAAFEKSITDQFDAIDDRSIFVTCGQTGPQNGPPDCGQSTFIFTDVDREGLAALDGVERVIASGEVVVSSIGYDGQDRAWESVEATTSDADEIRNADEFIVPKTEAR